MIDESKAVEIALQRYRFWPAKRAETKNALQIKSEKFLSRFDLIWCVFEFQP